VRQWFLSNERATSSVPQRRTVNGQSTYRKKDFYRGDALGWTTNELRGRRKSDPHKVRIVARLRRETTMTLEWVAQRLCMDSPTHVACPLQR
jgi:hypothetical protein